MPNHPSYPPPQQQVEYALAGYGRIGHDAFCEYNWAFYRKSETDSRLLVKSMFGVRHAFAKHAVLPPPNR